jgi:hypothetical protein
MQWKRNHEINQKYGSETLLESFNGPVWFAYNPMKNNKYIWSVAVVIVFILAAWWFSKSLPEKASQAIVANATNSITSVEVCGRMILRPATQMKNTASIDGIVVNFDSPNPTRFFQV